MLSEKFFLILEALRRSDSQPDGSTRIVSNSPHVPIKLPETPNEG